MKQSLYALGTIFLCFQALFSYAQCDPGEVPITFVMNTDAWGYEAYWQLTLATDDCDANPILIEGNLAQVDCNSGGSQVSGGGNGYPNNTTITLEDVCLIEGEEYAIHYVDDWGDGGLNFDILIGNIPVGSFQGTGSGNTFFFTAALPEGPLLDFPCGATPLFVDGAPAEGNNESAGVQNGEPAPEGGNCGLLGNWCEGGINNTIWFAITATSSDPLLITSCVVGTDFDTQLALYEVEDCLDFSTFMLIGANDDGGCGIANGFASTFYTSCLVEGETYYLQVDGWNGDTGNVFVTATTSNLEPSLNAQVNSVTCAPDKGESGNGSIFPYINGGGENFTCEWTGPNGFSSQNQDLVDLNAGEYSLTATDACGNVLTQSYTIINPAPIQVSFSIENPDCPLSEDGSITPNVTGGTAPYEFFWEGPDGFVSVDGINNNLNEGAYALELQDDNGCPFNANVNLTALNEVELFLGNDTTICIDDQLVLSGPLGYNYSWQDESTNQFFIVDAAEYGLGSHSFILSVENEFACSALDAITVNIDVCDNIEEALANFDFYPNPAENQITITSTEASGEVFLWSTSGQLIKSQKLSDFSSTIAVGDLAQGTYLLRYVLGEGRSTQRLFVKL